MIDTLYKFRECKFMHDIIQLKFNRYHMFSLPVQGIFDLFYLPFEQYQKDGRIVRGIQRGAQSFTARTALAALEITSRIIYLLQVCEIN